MAPGTFWQPHRTVGGWYGWDRLHVHWQGLNLVEDSIETSSAKRETFCRSCLMSDCMSSMHLVWVLSTEEMLGAV